MRRKSLDKRINNLEIAVAAIKKSHPEPVIIGELTLEEIMARLMDHEQNQLLDLIRSLQPDGVTEEQESNINNLIEIAHDRRDKGLIAGRRRRTIQECYSEMKERQAAGENIHYGDIESDEEFLEEE